MAANVQLPRVASELNPILICAPTARSGTTLVQRLMCSADNGICFGENLFGEMLLISRYVKGQVQFHENYREAETTGLEAVLGGDTARWMPDLSPEIESYKTALIRTFYVLPKYAQDYAVDIERPVWGMKRPSLDYQSLSLIMTLLPGARMIYVYRNIIDCLRSAKARGFVKTNEDVVKTCVEWRENMGAIGRWATEKRLLMLRYEDLVSDPAGIIPGVGRWVGLENIKLDVMDVKINTWKGEGEGRSPDQYVPPIDLTEEEMGIVRQEAGAALHRLYPGML